MDGRAFLVVAQELQIGLTEAHRRAAVGRAYYALLHEGFAALLRWGIAMPPRESLHSFVRLRFNYSGDVDLNRVGWLMDELARLRNQADYQLAGPGPFAAPGRSGQAVNDARAAIAMLDRIEADPQRRAAAIASIRP